MEFVNREEAERQAARFVTLINAAERSKVEAWFAMQAVADQVGPNSNVGVRGISWRRQRGRSNAWYALRARCVDGWLNAVIAAPVTLNEARSPNALAGAVAVFDRKIADLGGRTSGNRPKGTSRALRLAVDASPQGREWLGRVTSVTAQIRLLLMVNIADAYGRDGVNPDASLRAHAAFITFDDRASLVREHPDSTSANARVALIKHGDNAKLEPTKYVPRSIVTSLAIEAGVTKAEARMILRALLDGRSKRHLHETVDVAARMLAQGATDS